MENVFNENYEYFTPEEYETIKNAFCLTKAKRGLVLPIEVIEGFSKEEHEALKNKCFLECSGNTGILIHANTIGEMADAWKTYVNTVRSLLISELKPIDNEGTNAEETK